ncbi:MAG: class I SAM-dependent methyltransferase [Candidatus Paceibacterota bacterium]|jgi:SAM-dependent methyltransferase
MNPQVEKSFYTFGRYTFEGRFVSYYWQLREVLSLKPSSVVEVGVGDGVFGNFIQRNVPILYTSVDYAPDLKPDVVGSILALPLSDKSSDVACAFEVLEHLPFEEFDKALSELVRVARTHVVISIPHFGPTLSFSLKVPLLPLLRFSIKIPYPKRQVGNGHHFWELGKSGYPVALVRSKLLAYGALVRDFVPFGNPYHHFFVITL